MKKLILTCMLAALWMLGTVYASDADEPDPTVKDPLLQILIEKNVITEQQAQEVEAESNKKEQETVKKSELPGMLKNFKPIGKFYLSYQAGWQDFGDAGTTDYNSFLLKRGYFGADVAITSYFTARFVSDIHSDDTGDVKLRAKYLFGKFHGKGNNFITKPYMEFGLAHMPWLDFEEALNGFRMQDTMYTERNHLFNSADVGVLFGSDFGGSLSSDYKSKVNGHYAGKYGSWQIGVYNGGGYHAKEQNTNKVLEGRITVRPVPVGAAQGFQFSVFGIVGKGNQPSDTAPDWRLFNGMVSYESEYFTFTGQGSFGTGNQGGTAVNPDGSAAEHKGYSVFAAVHLPVSIGKVTLWGRTDTFNGNTEIYSDIVRRYIAGFAWHFYKSNIWLFDYQRTSHSVSSNGTEDRIQLTLQVSY